MGNTSSNEDDGTRRLQPISQVDETDQVQLKYNDPKN